MFDCFPKLCTLQHKENGQKVLQEYYAAKMYFGALGNCWGLGSNEN